MFKKRPKTDPSKPKIYAAIGYTVLFFLSLVHLSFDIYHDETESLARNIIMAGFMFSLSLFSWIIYNMHFKLYAKELNSKNPG